MKILEKHKYKYQFGPVKVSATPWYLKDNGTKCAFQKVYLKRPDGSRDPLRYWELYLMDGVIRGAHYINKVTGAGRRLRLNPRFE